MNALTLELTPDLLQRLQTEAARRQQPMEEVAVTLLEEKLASPVTPASSDEGERDRVRRVLQEAGLLSELSDELRAYAQQLKQRLGSEEEVKERRSRLAMRRLDPPLSQIILDMRGPKS